MVRKKEKNVADLLSDRVASSDSLMTATNMYMKNISQQALLTQEEEISLAGQRYSEDEEERVGARMTLVECNLRLVVKIAHEFKSKCGLPLRELISAGNDGLIHAVDKFDPDKGARFGTYAIWWIKQSIRRAIEYQTNAIRIPTQISNNWRKIQATRKRLTEELGRAPSNAEIGEIVGLTERAVNSSRKADLSFTSLNTLVNPQDNVEIMDLIADEKASSPDKVMLDNDSIDQLYHLLHQLKEREQRVLIMRFGLDGEDPMTLEVIAKHMGITRERIRQIQNMALRKIRQLMANKN
jgi:RNA polymerase primary sigma factor